jgi:hypothetical protein
MAGLIKSVQDLPFLYLTAAYAAVTSTLVLLWDVHKWRAAKKSDRVQLTIDVAMPDEESLDVIVKNTGKKTTTLLDFHVQTLLGKDITREPDAKEERISFQSTQKYILNEGEIHRVSCYNDNKIFSNCDIHGFAIVPIRVIVRPSGKKPETLTFIVN